MATPCYVCGAVLGTPGYSKKCEEAKPDSTLWPLFGKKQRVSAQGHKGFFIIEQYYAEEGTHGIMYVLKAIDSLHRIVVGERQVKLAK